jgi:hypothetical protein
MPSGKMEFKFKFNSYNLSTEYRKIINQEMGRIFGKTNHQSNAVGRHVMPTMMMNNNSSSRSKIGPITRVHPAALTLTL